MDEQTALVLSLQLLALFSIAGALLLYLICKIRAETGFESQEGTTGAGKPVLITSCDNTIGLQLALYLADRGFRVFAGLKEGASSGNSEDSVSSRVIRSWQKHRESLQVKSQGALVALPLDVTREDLLHEAVDIIRAHLPAGEDGIWAVINTTNVSYRGRLDQQDVTHWDAMLKNNVVGVLRTTRTFQSLLRNAGGRVITIGSTEHLGVGLVAYTATKHAVLGATNALREELGPSGIKIVSINPAGYTPEQMVVAPKLKKQEGETSVDIGGCLEYQPTILNSRALQIFEVALTTGNPKQTYNLKEKQNWSTPYCNMLKIV